MKEKYIKIKNLTVAESLLNFVNKELLTQTKIKKEVFWGHKLENLSDKLFKT